MLKPFQPNLFFGSDQSQVLTPCVEQKGVVRPPPCVLTCARVMQSHRPQLSFSSLSPPLVFSNLNPLSCMDGGGFFHTLTLHVSSLFSQGWLLPGAAATAKLPLYIPQIPAQCV